MKKQTQITLKGIIIAANWGKDGEVSALDFAGYDESMYHVANDMMGKQLRPYVRKSLTIEGLLETTVKGITVHVKSFKFEKVTAMR